MILIYLRLKVIIDTTCIFLELIEEWMIGYQLMIYRKPSILQKNQNYLERKKKNLIMIKKNFLKKLKNLKMKVQKRKNKNIMKKLLKLKLYQRFKQVSLLLIHGIFLLSQKVITPMGEFIFVNFVFHFLYMKMNFKDIL